MMVSMELHVRRRLPPGSPPLLVPPLRVAMMLCGAASCSRAYPLGLLLAARAAVCALPALCASRASCGGLLSRLVVPVFAYYPVLGFDHGWVVHFAIAAAAAARAARSERHAFWAWAGAEAGDAPTNGEALATVVSELGDAVATALAGMASRARAAASRLSLFVSRRIGDSGGGGQAFKAYAYGDKSTLLAYAASPAATTAVIFIKDACAQLAHRPTGGGGAAPPPPPAAPAGSGAPPILTRDQTIRLYAAAPLFPAIAVLASLVPLLMAVSPPWVRGRAFLAANRDAVLFLSASVRFTLATVASYRSLASSLGVAPVIASSNLPYSVVNTGLIALVPASAAARTAILLLRLAVVAIPPPIVAWPQARPVPVSLGFCVTSHFEIFTRSTIRATPRRSPSAARPRPRPSRGAARPSARRCAGGAPALRWRRRRDCAAVACIDAVILFDDGSIHSPFLRSVWWSPAGPGVGERRGSAPTSPSSAARGGAAPQRKRGAAGAARRRRHERRARGVQPKRGRTLGRKEPRPPPAPPRGQARLGARASHGARETTMR